jgi:steroid delta-isomerase-like uncharacterized protein
MNQSTLSRHDGTTPATGTAGLTRVDMDRLIEAHLEAERSGNPAGSVAVYTDDVEHDVVGSPTGPVQGKDAAKAFYEFLVQNISTETMVPVRSYYGDDFCVIEHDWTGTVPGSFLGVPGNGRRITFRMMHVWEFRDGLISRENVWLDGGGIVHQLTA